MSFEKEFNGLTLLTHFKLTMVLFLPCSSYFIIFNTAAIELLEHLVYISQFSFHLALLFSGGNYEVPAANRVLVIKISRPSPHQIRKLRLN